MRPGGEVRPRLTTHQAPRSVKHCNLQYFMLTVIRTIHVSSVLGSVTQDEKHHPSRKTRLPDFLCFSLCAKCLPCLAKAKSHGAAGTRRLAPASKCPSSASVGRACGYQGPYRSLDVGAALQLIDFAMIA